MFLTKRQDCNQTLNRYFKNKMQVLQKLNYRNILKVTSFQTGIWNTILK